MKPTVEQSKEFWERWGLKQNEALCWEYEGKYVSTIIPDTHLNNLFKYAVPKAIDKIMAEQECSSDLAYAILFKKWLQKLELDIPNHEGTLFWTLGEMI